MTITWQHLLGMTHEKAFYRRIYTVEIVSLDDGNDPEGGVVEAMCTLHTNPAVGHIFAESVEKLTEEQASNYARQHGIPERWWENDD